MKRLPVALGVAGALAAGGCVAVAFTTDAGPSGALAAWACAVGFAASTLVALLWLVLLADLADASWFLVLRPVATAITQATPLLAALLVPVAFGLPRVYAWAGPAVELASLDEAARRAVEHHRAWQNAPFFVARAAAYVVCWSALARAAAGRRSQAFAAVGLIVTTFTLTFAAFDWWMSAEAGWSSAIYGMYVLAGGLSAAVGAVAVLAWLARRAGALPAEVGDAHAHALGRVLLVAIGSWSYLAYCQLLLVWIADLPRESVFYVERFAAPWRSVSWALGLGHFAVPVLLLLSRALKRSLGRVALLGAWAVAMHALDAAWLVLPAGHHAGAGVAAAAVLAFVAVALSLAAFGAARASRSSLALDREDPEIAASLEYESP